MFFKSLQFVKGVKIFGYGLASFFLYSLTNQLYLKYTKKNITNEDDESDESKRYHIVINITKNLRNFQLLS